MDLSPLHKVWHADANSPSEGGHAFTIVGYDDRTKVFKFINSWSTSWGDGGYGYLTYDTFLARIAEGYIMHLPGDPEIALAEADFAPTPVEDVQVFAPPVQESSAEQGGAERLQRRGSQNSDRPRGQRAGERPWGASPA